MISSQLKQEIENFDEIIRHDHNDFTTSGLKSGSVIRISRIAVVEQKILIGSVGEISNARLLKVKKVLSNWIYA